MPLCHCSRCRPEASTRARFGGRANGRAEKTRCHDRPIKRRDLRLPTTTCASAKWREWDLPDQKETHARLVGHQLRTSVILRETMGVGTSAAAFPDFAHECGNQNFDRLVVVVLPAWQILAKKKWKKNVCLTSQACIWDSGSRLLVTLSGIRDKTNGEWSADRLSLADPDTRQGGKRRWRWR